MPEVKTNNEQDRYKLRQMARRLTSELRSMMVEYDNYTAPNHQKPMPTIRTEYGMVAYTRVSMATDHEEVQGITTAKPSHFQLLSATRPNLHITDIDLFQRIIHQTARNLNGGSSEGIVEVRNDMLTEHKGKVLSGEAASMRLDRPAVMTLAWKAA